MEAAAAARADRGRASTTSYVSALLSSRVPSAVRVKSLAFLLEVSSERQAAEEADREEKEGPPGFGGAAGAAAGEGKTLLTLHSPRGAAATALLLVPAADAEAAAAAALSLSLPAAASAATNSAAVAALEASTASSTPPRSAALALAARANCDEASAPGSVRAKTRAVLAPLATSANGSPAAGSDDDDEDDETEEEEPPRARMTSAGEPACLHSRPQRGALWRDEGSRASTPRPETRSRHGSHSRCCSVSLTSPIPPPLLLLLLPHMLLPLLSSAARKSTSGPRTFRAKGHGLTPRAEAASARARRAAWSVERSSER